MASKEECDQYAAELTRRFDELVQWAMTNWPKPETPLLSSDFGEGRREIGQIVGPKLGDADGNDTLPRPAFGDDDDGQYRNVTPMPWP
ncbi:hypothetical protein [Noviherbaspirillum sp.]|uniref:hypothetical protein n=1 Tax=Noviherbaspirillum sp. TaxID=1926288 RepID=UPI002D730072|nr:hypothetical protein [Noviherbaspirillum sp.]HZW21494.1 hypothetical protein [Noviherbaspirillum sp.]